jgi:hypothetical protein
MFSRTVIAISTCDQQGSTGDRDRARERCARDSIRCCRTGTSSIPVFMELFAQSICHAAAWPDHAKNVRAYGPNASARDIALGTTSAKMGDEAMPFTTALERETVGRRA